MNEPPCPTFRFVRRQRSANFVPCAPSPRFPDALRDRLLPFPNTRWTLRQIVRPGQMQAARLAGRKDSGGKATGGGLVLAVAVPVDAQQMLFFVRRFDRYTEGMEDEDGQ